MTTSKWQITVIDSYIQLQDSFDLYIRDREGYFFLYLLDICTFSSVKCLFTATDDL